MKDNFCIIVNKNALSLSIDLRHCSNSLNDIRLLLAYGNPKVERYALINSKTTIKFYKAENNN